MAGGTRLSISDQRQSATFVLDTGRRGGAKVGSSRSTREIETFRCQALDTGAVTLIQRFGSAANLNIHLHCLVLDGVYRRTGGAQVFQEARAPTGEALQGLLEKTIVRLMKKLPRRKALERLCRYISRPAIANARLKEDAAGNVVLQLKGPWRDGTTHLGMTPLEFMQPLAALVPRPRLGSACVEVRQLGSIQRADRH